MKYRVKKVMSREERMVLNKPSREAELRRRYKKDYMPKGSRNASINHGLKNTYNTIEENKEKLSIKRKMRSCPVIIKKGNRKMLVMPND